MITVDALQTKFTLLDFREFLHGCISFLLQPLALMKEDEDYPLCVHFC